MSAKQHIFNNVIWILKLDRPNAKCRENPSDALFNKQTNKQRSNRAAKLICVNINQNPLRGGFEGVRI